jgi:hypothetical protein
MASENFYDNLRKYDSLDKAIKCLELEPEICDILVAGKNETEEFVYSFLVFNGEFALQSITCRSRNANSNKPE